MFSLEDGEDGEYSLAKSCVDVSPTKMILRSFPGDAVVRAVVISDRILMHDLQRSVSRSSAILLRGKKTHICFPPRLSLTLAAV